MTKQKNPKIRFTEFTDAWEQRKFKDIAGRQSRTSDGSNLPSVEYEDIVSGFGRLNKNLLEKDSGKKGILFNSGDVLFGKLRPYLKNWLFATFDGLAVGDWWVLRPKNVSPIFLYNLIQSQRFENASNLSSGSKMPRSDWKIVSETDFSIPGKLEEQSQIGSFFQTLDSLIAFHQRKLEELKSFKSIMLSKMFPKHGQTVPEIRLAGFDGEWEKTKLRDVSERVQGNDGRMDLPTLTISAAQGWLSQKDRFSQNIAGKEQKNYTLLKRGELSYNHGNSKLAKYGVVFELNNYEEALVPRVYHSFKVNELANPRFIETMFATKQPDRELRKLVSSGARMDGLLNINYDDFMGISIIIPTVHEQETIGEFFSNLDDLISSTQLKIEELETLKKKLLQEMFV